MSTFDNKLDTLENIIGTSSRSDTQLKTGSLLPSQILSTAFNRKTNLSQTFRRIKTKLLANYSCIQVFKQPTHTKKSLSCQNGKMANMQERKKTKRLRLMRGLLERKKVFAKLPKRKSRHLSRLTYYANDIIHDHNFQGTMQR